jgi:hypothetical protein
LKKIILSLLLALSFPLAAKDMETRMNQMEKLLLKMQMELKDKDAKIKQMETKLNKSDNPKKITDQELLNRLTQEGNKAENYEKRSKKDTSQKILSIGKNANTFLETLNMATIFNMAAGGSSVRESDLEEFQGGAHDPKKRGFTLQQIELSLSGTVDNLFDAEAHIIFTEDEVELEEAFITTRSLPGNLQLKAGSFLTEFGIVNSQHLHSWDFIDQPIVNTRIFGSEGMRAAGARLSWLAPLPWYSEVLLGVQNSSGDTAPSFRGSGHAHGEEEEEHGDEDFEEAIGNRPYTDRDTRNLDDLVYLARWVNSFELNERTTLKLGASNLWGENHTGGSTWIYGADFKLVINDEELGRAGWIVQGELIKRNYQADSFQSDSFSHAANDINDWGFYLQAIKALNKQWSLGIRYDYASGSGSSFEGAEVVAREDDFNRSDRYRISPLLVYQHSEFTNFKLQYNYDKSDTGGTASSLWLGVEVLLGSHPAHKL